ncbi:MAG: penicillin-binding protein 2 [Syntrophobacterales bacterium]|jgi:penicillin-binding protein 2|nr:penicillin-binding protein 2 [Syntrophobacterales bacterium]
MSGNTNPLNRHDSGIYRPKVELVIIVICVVFCVLILRVWHLQVIKGDEMTQRAETNSIRSHKIHSLRGMIYDRDGNILVDNQPSYDIVFVPDKTRDLKTVAQTLESFYRDHSLTMTQDLSRLAEDKSHAPIRLDKNVNAKKIAVVETRSRDLPGVTVEIVPNREYLYGDMMAHLIGYVGEVSRAEIVNDSSKKYEGGDFIGKYGIERFFDTSLRGENGAEEIEVNARGRKIKSLRKVEPTQGNNLHLTIDTSLQKKVWEAMGGRRGAAVVTSVQTGEILAMVSTPSFNPNLFTGGIAPREWQKISASPQHPMENRAISGQYPPGSTYKLVIAAAALEEKIVTPQKTFFCDGTFKMGSHTFRCWRKSGHGYVNLYRSIVESCDVYYYHLGNQLGVDTIAKYAYGCGFGKVTGLTLPREKGGLVPTKEWKKTARNQSWLRGETIPVSIGQGYNLATPLQLAHFYAALANGGILYQPVLVRQIDGPDGQPVWKAKPEETGRLPISEANMKLLNRALWGVVNDGGGTGSAVRRPERDVCGKTGTSQVVGLPMSDEARKRRVLSAAHKDHALFVAFAPYNKPEIAVSVIAENAGGGGAVAAPIARKIIDAYFAGKKKNTPHASLPASSPRMSTPPSP